MGRRGKIVRGVWWPSKGDLLENQEEGVIWTCVRANTYIDEKTEEKTRYALFIGRSAEFDEPIRMAIHDAGDPDFEDLLDQAEVIHKNKPGGLVAYEWDDTTETWRSA